MAYKNFKKTEFIDELGIELRKVRTLKDLTLAQVSEALEQNGTHLSGIMLGRIETGQRRIDDDLFQALCDYYHVDPNVLMIRACQAHITNLQPEHSSDITETNTNWIIETYLNLPEHRQADIRTMLRLYSYMENFKELDS